ncbi:hypothetical protein [Polycladidibacter stylochi]|uniref:hypothetical protein n=1 Tax=Polycladidibacter stylochi TaxID=1807766 RepID=UPI00082F1A5B|nr:hypothetical protein [Pseudovibrio stylochi]
MKVADNSTIAHRIEQAFDSASKVTGTSFTYLLRAAAKESSLEPSAKAQNSTASGLFQFIESTWLETLKKNGDALGLGDYAAHIERGRNGNYTVANATLKKQILDLRHDPEVSALVAGAFTSNNATELRRELQREPSAGELYLAHFLGARGGAKLIKASVNAPQMPAAVMFPTQAKANHSIFYGSDNLPRTVADVHEKLIAQFSGVDALFLKKGLESTQVAQNDELVNSPAARAHSRIFTAFRVAEEVGPFDRLFRDNQSSQKRIALNSSYLTAFTEQEQVRDAQKQLPRPKITKINQPLDLTEFLKKT